MISSLMFTFGVPVMLKLVMFTMWSPDMRVKGVRMSTRSSERFAQFSIFKTSISDAAIYSLRITGK